MVLEDHLVRSKIILGSVQEHILCFNWKPLPVKPTHTCEVKIAKAQVAAVAVEINLMLSEETIKIGLGNKQFLTYFYHSPKMGKPLHYESKVTQPLYYLQKIQDDHPIGHQGGYTCRAVGSLTQHQVSVLSNSKWKKHQYLLWFRWTGKIYQFKTKPFSLPIVPKTFTKIMKPILLHCWKGGIMLFLYLDVTLILAIYYSKVKDRQKVAQLLQRLGFILNL